MPISAVGHRRVGEWSKQIVLRPGSATWSWKIDPSETCFIMIICEYLIRQRQEFAQNACFRLAHLRIPFMGHKICIAEAPRIQT
jgi:hypothetical protein